MLTVTIDDFFGRYASMMNNALFGDVTDLKFITDSFSEYIVGANPLGVYGGKNDDAFEVSIQKGIDFYKSIGIISMNISDKEVTFLDELHAMVKISWTCIYGTKGNSGEINFMVVYLMQLIGGVPKIFAFITGDEHAALVKNHLVQD